MIEQATLRVTLGLAVAVASAQPGLAETCQQKFQRIFLDNNGKGPVKIFITQEIKGAPTSKNIHYNTDDGNWMTEMVVPANMQWTLLRDNVMYTSADKGKTWKKLRAFDSQKGTNNARAQMVEDVKTASDIACGKDSLSGVAHETIEGRYTAVKYKTTHQIKYWLNESDGWITKTTMKTKQAAFESFTTQLIERAPGLKLPKP
jgi:hypothetical protein